MLNSYIEGYIDTLLYHHCHVLKINDESEKKMKENTYLTFKYQRDFFLYRFRKYIFVECMKMNEDGPS